MLKETFKPRQRRALGNIIAVIMVIVISIAGVGVVASLFFDTADTASVIDAIEISSQAVYSDQGFVSVQVKNNGNTAVDDIYAVLLVDTNTGASVVNCASGTEPMLVTTNTVAVTSGSVVQTVSSLDLGESVTISGSLSNFDNIVVDAANDALDASAVLAAVCNNDCAENLQNRGEYILQIIGKSDGDIISKTQAV